MRPPEITIHDDESLDINFLSNGFVSATGSLKNISGTVQEVKFMIEHHGLIREYFDCIGSFEIGETGERTSRRQAGPLDGSTFCLQTIEVEKCVVQSNLNVDCEDLHKTVEDNNDDEL